MLEDELREDLEGCKIDLSNYHGDTKMLEVLLENVKDFRFGYLLSYMPEQGEDLFSILTDKKMVIKIEISRVYPDEKPIISTKTFEEYKKGTRGRRETLRLQILEEMFERDLKDLEK